jgi:antitoxin MazE
MKVRLIRIGNSRGIRIPRELMRVYGLREGAELEIEERQEGILLRVGEDSHGLISWDAAYQEMTAESLETQEWSEWDHTTGDGIES